jgi:hypothetical protein
LPENGASSRWRSGVRITSTWRCRGIHIGSDGIGRFQFGLVSGDIDGRVEQCGNAPRFEFSWSGQEENDPVCGRAVIENGELNGRIYLHLADDSAFRATKSA